MLANDTKVKVACIHCNGVLCGKVIHKGKSLSSLETGCGMSSAIFGWDMHDVLHNEETNLTGADSGNQGYTAVIVLEPFRRLFFSS